MKKTLLVFTMLIVTLVLSSCSQAKGLEGVGLDGLSGKQILSGVADGSILVDGFALSVYDDELLVIVDEERIAVDMPTDEFYLSVAPYIDITHKCTFHSATGCRGELKQQTFFVEFTDANGNLIISESMETLSNGFIDIWLPRDIEGTLTITQGDLMASKVISTETGEPTCETTMQLK